MEYLFVALATVFGMVLGSHLSTMFIRARWQDVNPIPSNRVYEMLRTLQDACTKVEEHSRWARLSVEALNAEVSIAKEKAMTLEDLCDEFRQILESHTYSELYDYLHSREPELIRLIGERVSTSLTTWLASKSLSFKNEYTLISSIDDLDLDVELSLTQLPDARLRTSLINALAKTFPLEDRHLTQDVKSYFTAKLGGKNLKAFLDLIGEEATRIHWKGSVAVQRRGVNKSERLKLA